MVTPTVVPVITLSFGAIQPTLYQLGLMPWIMIFLLIGLIFYVIDKYYEKD